MSNNLHAVAIEAAIETDTPFDVAFARAAETRRTKAPKKTKRDLEVENRRMRHALEEIAAATSTEALHRLRDRMRAQYPDRSDGGQWPYTVGLVEAIAKGALR